MPLLKLPKGAKERERTLGLEVQVQDLTRRMKVMEATVDALMKAQGVEVPSVAFADVPAVPAPVRRSRHQAPRTE